MSIKEAITWQYDKAPALTSLILSKDTWYFKNDDQFWINWYYNGFNLNTANNYGIGLWAIILNLPLEIFAPLGVTPVWGFGPYNENFHYANFASGAGSLNLTKEEKIIVLKMAWYRYVGNGTVPFINGAIADAFVNVGGGYVLDHQDMTIEYVFNQPISTNLRNAFTNYNILPSIAGVKTLIRA
jgi:hypothetical protein